MMILCTQYRESRYRLVGGLNPSENMSSSVGMIIPNKSKNKKNPNHQPDLDIESI